jgi:hypothetical protein
MAAVFCLHNRMRPCVLYVVCEQINHKEVQSPFIDATASAFPRNDNPRFLNASKSRGACVCVRG